MLDFLKNIGPVELIVIIMVIGGLFGSKKIKDLAGGLGESAKELKKVKHELDGVKSEVADAIGGVKSDV